MDIIERLLEDVSGRSGRLERPVVTLSYAQSLDGSLTTSRGRRAAISCAETKLLTHRLRAAHAAILVGIGTVLADDPQLTARLAGGPNPLPVVLDRSLRIPPDSRLIRRGDVRPWVACGEDAPAGAVERLAEQGVRLLRVAADDQGRLDLRAVLRALWQDGRESLMVEGGARVISSFLSERLADQAVLTIAPVWFGGPPGLESHVGRQGVFPCLLEPHFQPMGRDLVAWGRLGEGFYAEESAVFQRAAAG